MLRLILRPRSEVEISSSAQVWRGLNRQSLEKTVKGAALDEIDKLDFYTHIFHHSIDIMPEEQTNYWIAFSAYSKLRITDLTRVKNLAASHSKL